MRKLFWCGAACLVVFAAAVYYVADNAAKHPDSYWRRCLDYAASLGLYANPFVPMHPVNAGQVAQDAAHHVNAAVGAGILAQADGNAVADPIEGELVPGNEEQFEVPPPVENVTPFEPIRVEPMPSEAVQNEGERWIIDEGLIMRGGLTPPSDIEEPKTGSTEESELVFEDEMEPEPVPMPYAEEESEDSVCPEHRCGNWFVKLLRLGGIISETPDDEDEPLPMPSVCDDEPQDQGTEDETKSDCQENPAYHHHYHGCPYMGGCPYPYSRAIPVVTPVEPQQPASPETPVRKKKPACGSGLESQQPATPETPVQKKKPTCESGSGVKKILWYDLDEENVQDGIDTMEFRPSDDPRESPGNLPF
jgi:hypothetical protein